MSGLLDFDLLTKIKLAARTVLVGSEVLKIPYEQACSQ